MNKLQKFALAGLLHDLSVLFSQTGYSFDVVLQSKIKTNDPGLIKILDQAKTCVTTGGQPVTLALEQSLSTIFSQVQIHHQLEFPSQTFGPATADSLTNFFPTQQKQVQYKLLTKSLVSQFESLAARSRVFQSHRQMSLLTVPQGCFGKAYEKYQSA